MAKITSTYLAQTLEWWSFYASYFSCCSTCSGRWTHGCSFYLLVNCSIEREIGWLTATQHLKHIAIDKFIMRKLSLDESQLAVLNNDGHSSKATGLGSMSGSMFYKRTPQLDMVISEDSIYQVGVNFLVHSWYSI